MPSKNTSRTRGPAKSKVKTTRKTKEIHLNYTHSTLDVSTAMGKPALCITVVTANVDKYEEIVRFIIRTELPFSIFYDRKQKCIMLALEHNVTIGLIDPRNKLLKVLEEKFLPKGKMKKGS